MKIDPRTKTKDPKPRPPYQQICSAIMVGLSILVYSKIVSINKEAREWSLVVESQSDVDRTASDVIDYSATRQVNETLKPLCLTTPFYGQTNNRVIEIGKMLHMVAEEGQGRKVALDNWWSEWYEEHFDPRHDIVLEYEGECDRSFDAREAFFVNGWDLSFLGNLLPRLDYRQAAEEILQTWPHGDNYISVHRRNLDGTCHFFAKCPQARLTRKKERKCTKERDPEEECSAEIRLRSCDLEYQDVANPNDIPVILFTDRQVPEKDATFPVIFNATTHLFVEMLLMAKSRVHWGNPRSTVDIIVASWRRGIGMEPRQCYDPQKIHYLE